MFLAKNLLREAKGACEARLWLRLKCPSTLTTLLLKFVAQLIVLSPSVDPACHPVSWSTVHGRGCSQQPGVADLVELLDIIRTCRS